MLQVTCSIIPLPVCIVLLAVRFTYGIHEFRSIWVLGKKGSFTLRRTTSTLATHSQKSSTPIIISVIAIMTTILIVVSAYIFQFGHAHANATAAAQDPRFATLTAGTTMMNEVPATLPQQGVTINDQFIVHPLTSTQAQLSMIAENDAITTARTYANTQPFATTTLLGSFTNLGSVPPPGATDGTTANVIQNVPAWIVTFTTTDPQNVFIGAKPDATQPPATSAPTHFNVVINANTGTFILGFFTA